jgi:hypothetical protein
MTYWIQQWKLDRPGTRVSDGKWLDDVQFPSEDAAVQACKNMLNGAPSGLVRAISRTQEKGGNIDTLLYPTK